MRERQILMVVSGAQETLATYHAIPCERLTSRGATVTVASPDGRVPDGAPDGEAALDVSDGADLARFGAVFVADCDRAMADLARNPHVARVIAELHGRGAVIATLGHGAAALLSAAARSDGQWLFDGYRMTAMTDEEEGQTEHGRLSPSWSLETALKQAGAIFDDSGAAWTSHVVVDRNLITGQNPQSADAVADAILTHLEVL